MALHSLKLPEHALWFGVLVALSTGSTFAIACAAPLAAFAAAAALTLPRRGAFAASGAVWLANQSAGFFFLHYPLALDAFLWGLALGVVTVLAAWAAVFVKERVSLSPATAALAAFFGAFTVYEGALFLISTGSGSGISDYTVAIVSRILAINAASFAALFLLHCLCASARAAQKGEPRMDPSGRQTSSAIAG
ncbi:MAG TPA: hypothetical protein VFF88_02380 [Methylocella sp.]|nr:hypothetical protein [Methylocella sp.]